MLFLDTHVVVWLYAGEKGLFTSHGHELVDNNDLVISPIVQLELEYLYETNRVSTRGKDIVEYLQRVVQMSVDPQPFPQIVDRAMGIKWTRDPFDRIITAQADLAGATLLTKDRTIHNYYVNAVW